MNTALCGTGDWNLLRVTSSVRNLVLNPIDSSFPKQALQCLGLVSKAQQWLCDGKGTSTCLEKGKKALPGKAACRRKYQLKSLGVSCPLNLQSCYLQ